VGNVTIEVQEPYVELIPTAVTITESVEESNTITVSEPDVTIQDGSSESQIQVQEPYLELVLADSATVTESLVEEETNITIKVSESAVTIHEGISGPQGPVGVSDKHYVHTQASPSSTWTITHNLDKKPSITVVDSAENVVIGNVVYDSANMVTISFTGGFSGKAYLN
jgi:hypothetical protein